MAGRWRRLRRQDDRDHHHDRHGHGEDGARITGVNQVDVVAAQKKLDTVAKTRARTFGLGGDTDATASNTLTADSLVTSEQRRRSPLETCTSRPSCRLSPPARPRPLSWAL